MQIVNGNIIDMAPALGTWFIIFADERQSVEGFASKQDAIDHLNQNSN